MRVNGAKRVNRMVRCEELDLAYLAGLIDGEGAICLNRTWDYRKNGEKVPHLTVKLEIGLNSQALVKYLKKRYGGFIHTKQKEGYNNSYHWILSEKKAVPLLRKCFKFLKIKSFHAMQIIAYHHDKTRSKTGGYNGMYKRPKHETEKRLRYWKIMRKLNRKGRKLT